VRRYGKGEILIRSSLLLRGMPSDMPAVYVNFRPAPIFERTMKTRLAKEIPRSSLLTLRHSPCKHRFPLGFARDSPDFKFRMKAPIRHESDYTNQRSAAE